MLNPGKSYQNVLALSVVADLEDLVFFSIAAAIRDVEPKKERRKKLDFMLDTINKVIEQLQNDMTTFIEEQMK